jgi:hypothetical protein
VVEPQTTVVEHLVECDGLSFTLRATTKKAQNFEGLKRPYIPQKPIKLLKYIVKIVYNYDGPHFNSKAI